MNKDLLKTNAHKDQPQTLDELLERQWEQGSQFLMEQASHFDSKYCNLLLYNFQLIISKFYSSLCPINILQYTNILRFTVASLLSSLHQLKEENLDLEDSVDRMVQRRDHLLAVRARLLALSSLTVATPNNSGSQTGMH